jgi:uncharacterized protein YggU (UPF0235/DUF167 family)
MSSNRASISSRGLEYHRNASLFLHYRVRLARMRPFLLRFLVKSVIVALRVILTPLVWFELLSQRVFKWIYRSRGVYYYTLRRGANGYERAEGFFAQIEGILKGASEIRIAVGEMGHDLMDNERLIAGLKDAYVVNHAKIEIVHGPRVDPKTTLIYDLARDDVVKLYRMPKYRAHHFMHVTDPHGSVSVIDESTHIETYWEADRHGVIRTYLRGRVRSYYVSPQSNRRAKDLKEVFDARKATANRVFSHPQLYPAQELSLGTLSDAASNLLAKYLIQPVGVFFDAPLDLKVRSAYQGVGGNGNRNNIDMPNVERTPNPSNPGHTEKWNEPPTKEIELKITLDDIPEGPTCDACGLQTVRALVEYVCGTTYQVKAKEAPGYRCPRDGLEYLSGETLLEFLPTARDFFLGIGELQAAEALDETIKEESERVVRSTN